MNIVDLYQPVGGAQLVAPRYSGHCVCRKQWVRVLARSNECEIGHLNYHHYLASRATLVLVIIISWPVPPSVRPSVRMSVRSYVHPFEQYGVEKQIGRFIEKNEKGRGDGPQMLTHGRWSE